MAYELKTQPQAENLEVICFDLSCAKYLQIKAHLESRKTTEFSLQVLSGLTLSDTLFYKSC